MSRLPARISSTELMPPERHYQPMRIPGPRIIGFVAWIGLVMATFGILFLGTPLIALIPLAPSLFLIWRLRRSIVRTNQQNQDGITLLAAGEYDDAALIFDDLSRNRWGWSHAVFVLNRAVVYRMEGRPQRALSLLNAVETSGRMTTRAMRPLVPNLYIETALCHGVVGNLERAASYVEQARQRLPHRGDGRLLLVEAIIWIRNGDAELALRHMASRWRHAEGALTGASLKALRIICAFAHEQAGNSGSDDFRLMLAGVHPWTEGELLWLTATWSEMDDFVRRHLG